jgi:dienelactone hydrolase
MRGTSILLVVIYAALTSGLGYSCLGFSYLSNFGLGISLSIITPAEAAEPVFRMHALNVDSKYPACAALDVNHDGKLDVLSGGWWYEAPSWKRHRVREVQSIRGRFDDYSNLPLDVNGDGWLDIVSVNYRSQSLYWVEHPGQDLGTWSRHLIDEPGAMETGRMVDIDGDGQLDLLPNGLKFAAWWEVRRTVTGKPEWVRHDLPIEIAGHGVGCGDINGDGRRDLVGPEGWLEAPVDPRRDRWIWHPDFKLDRDCGLPIFVHDVDADGDADLIWGRGHRIGLYWMEQQVGADASVTWQRHAIDTSWSQPHSLLMADINQDGQLDLVAGKRYMGHDGKDPGEYDPLVAFWYQFDRATHTWKRSPISPGGPAGFGLDPKAVDLDMDGDIDIIAAGRSGLYWFENLLVDSSAPTDTASDDPSLSVRREVPPNYKDHKDVSFYLDRSGHRQAIQSPSDLATRRAHILLGMQQAMGPLPSSDQRVPLRIKVIDETETEKYLRRKITFASEPGDRVPAYVLIPKNLAAPAPAMLCLHQTTRSGKDEPAGLSGRSTLHYAHELAELAFVCIVPDYPSFGEYPYDFKKQGGHYASGSMKAIWNNHRAIDVLQAMPEVNHDRIGCIGHSLGGHNSLFTAVFDQRIRAVVTSCGFTPFHDYYGGKIAGWTSDRYMPRLRDRYGNDADRVPFDFYEVLTAIAPRAVFINAPLRDSNFDVAGVKKVVAAVGPVYKLRQASQRLTVRYPDSAHDFPDDIRHEAYGWLREQLGK